MHCTYTAQGFLACPNINVQKIEKEPIRKCVRRPIVTNIQQEHTINSVTKSESVLDEKNRIYQEKIYTYEEDRKKIEQKYLNNLS